EVSSVPSPSPASTHARGATALRSRSKRPSRRRRHLLSATPGGTPRIPRRSFAPRGSVPSAFSLVLLPRLRELVRNRPDLGEDGRVRGEQRLARRAALLGLPRRVRPARLGEFFERRALRIGARVRAIELLEEALVLGLGRSPYSEDH